MDHFYKYAVAQFATSALRSERLNLGLVVDKDGALEVFLPRALDKVRAISAAINVDHIRSELERLPVTYSYLSDQVRGNFHDLLIELQEITPISFACNGEFRASSRDQYNIYISRLLSALVEPEQAPVKQVRAKGTKLLTNVKTAFRSERVLARKGEGLDAHRIVANYKVAEGLPADLVLKNGAMHIVQTVDSPPDESSGRRTIVDIALSALVFEQARMLFGENETRSNLIYRATSSHESLISPSLDAAEHQGARLVNWESRDDRTRFIVEISSLADPIADVRQRIGAGIHASIQPKFQLN